MKPPLLLQAVREVSLLANPARPETVSQRVFDATVEQHKQFADLPSARAIARKLKYPWPKLLELAHSTTEPYTRHLGKQQADEIHDFLTSERIAYVLKLVAGRRNLSTLTKRQYEIERERLLKKNRSRWLHGRKLRLPTAVQICIWIRNDHYASSRPYLPIAGAWNQALELAGLKVREKSARQLPNKLISPLDLIERYYDAHETQPTPVALSRFARVHGLPYKRITSRVKWNALIQDWKATRAQQGLPEPAPPPPSKQSAYRLTRVRDTRKTVPSPWKDKDKCVNIIIKYLEQLPNNTRPTANNYEAWRQQQASPAPSVPTLAQHGGWVKTREQAIQLMMRQPRRPKTP
jgi:hypothetical protein